MRRVVGVTFSGSYLPGSLLIQGATRYHYAHVAADLDNGEVLDATYSHGVAQRKLSYPKSGWQRSYLLSWTEKEQREMFHLLAEELGKGYDVYGALGVPFGAGWEESGKWFCSELIGACAQRVGRLALSDKRIRRLSPEKLFGNLEGMIGK
jgi:hypothetical protein